MSSLFHKKIHYRRFVPYIVIMACKILMIKCYERLNQFLSRRGRTSMKKNWLLARIDCSSGKAQRHAIEDHLTEKGKHCVPTCVCACVCARHKCGWRAQCDPMHGLHGCIWDRVQGLSRGNCFKMCCYLSVQSCRC